MVKKAFLACAALTAGLCSGATYYKIGTDAAGQSSFAGNVSGSNGWAADASASATVAVTDWAGSDFIVNSGRTLRVSTQDAATTFGGRTLTLAEEGYLTLKKGNNGGSRRVTVADLRVDGRGVLGHAQDKSEFVLDGAVSLLPDAAFTLMFGLSNTSDDWRNLVVDAPIAGDETTALVLNGSGNQGVVQTSQATLNNVGDFRGTISAAGSPRNLTLVVNGPFGGTLTSLPNQTVVASFDYDGLPAETGLRLATATPDAAVKTKLLFRTAAVDLWEGGHPILTFPAGSSVDPGAYTVMGSNTANGAAAKLVLDPVENADGTVSLVTRVGRTFYKLGSEPAGKTSWYTNVSDTIGWTTTKGAGPSTPFSAEDMSISDFIVDNLGLRTPEQGMYCTFGGRSLTLTGSDPNGNRLMFKGPDFAVYHVADLRVDDAMIFNGNGGRTYTLAGKLTIGAGRICGFDASDSGTRTIIVDSDVHGDATSTLRIADTNGSGTPVYYLNNLANFTGLLDVPAAKNTKFKLTVNGAFNGSLLSLGKTVTFCVDYDGLPADKGLRVANLSVPEGLKTQLTLFSETADFAADGLPLLTFPAGAQVNAADFTIAYARRPELAAAVIPALKTLTADDGSVVLAVDGSAPLYAKLKDDGTGTFAWRFYGSDWTDVTAACGLTAPTADLTVCFDSTAEYEALKACPCTCAGYRMTALEVTADCDLTSAGFTFASDRGLEIDLAGHEVVFPASFFADAAGAATDPVRLEWVDARKNIYVDTGFKPDQNTCVEMDVTVQNKMEYWFGAWNENYNNGAFCLGNDGDGSKNEVYVGYGNQGGGLVKPVVANGRHTVALDAGSVKVDGAVVRTLTPNNFALGYNLFLFAQNRKGTSTPGSAQGTIRCHGCRIYSAGTLVRDFIPARVGGTIGLYDRVNRKMYAGGGGLLFAGPEAAENPATTVTDTVGGGACRAFIPEKVNQYNPGVDLRGKLAFVKDGAGTFVSQRRDLAYTGGNRVVAGRLMTVPGNGDNADWSAKYATLGALNSEIVVEPEGTLDIAANYDFLYYHVILAGGTLRSGKVVDDGPILQSQLGWGGVGWLTLTADSTFYLRGNVVFSGRTDTPVDLGGHTLTVDAPVNDKAVQWLKDLTNGTVRLVGKSDAKESFNVRAAMEARTVDFVDHMGLNPLADMRVRNYACTRTWNREQVAGTAELAVFGTFTPASDYFYGCTLQDGATLDLSSRTGVWSTTSRNTTGRKTVTFADDATVKVAFGSRAVGGQKVVDWTDNTPENLATLRFVCLPGLGGSTYKLSARDDGLYVSLGTVIFVR